MKTKRFLFSLIFSIPLFGLLLAGYSMGADPRGLRQNKIVEKPMRAELIFSLGSDKENEDFHKPASFAVDKEGKIFILDRGNSRIQCFSPEGKFLFSFGKMGQGPGELSNYAAAIKILEDGNIYVIDNHAFRINAYDPKGRFLFMGKTTAFFDDILLIQKKYYLSSILLKENHIPIHFSRTLGDIEKSFGIFIEPSLGLVKEVQKERYPAGFELRFSGNWTNLATNSTNEIIFSQRLPYRIIKYDAEGWLLRDVSGIVEYDTQNRYKFVREGRWGGIDEVSPCPYFFPPKVNKDDSLMVPFVNPEKDYLFIDHFDHDLILIARYKAPLKIVDSKKRDYIRQVKIDDMNNIYFLINYEDDPPQLLKYKLILN